MKSLFFVEPVVVVEATGAGNVIAAGDVIIEAGVAGDLEGRISQEAVLEADVHAVQLWLLICFLVHS